jgi:UDPglucose--hexose-1-phosphate uridylyltransferase
MSEFRQDPLSRRWVIVGSDRAARPNEFVELPVARQPIPCPFCAGNEHETPEEVRRYVLPGASGWQVRVVPNKYPAVDVQQACPGCLPLGSSLGSPVPGFGRHEVIIESPRHLASFSELSDAETELVFRAYRDRLLALKSEGRYAYVQIFKNAGPAAGASLEHIHSQLLALPAVPEVVAQELASSAEHFAKSKKSLVQSIIENEIAAGERIVAQTGNCVAFCPFASRFPYEVWIAPAAHLARFELASDSLLAEVAQLVSQVIRRIESATSGGPYNYFLHTQPFTGAKDEHYHWHLEILPRVTKVAGFEWSTGCFINPCPPEAAAAQLRSA